MRPEGSDKGLMNAPLRQCCWNNIMMQQKAKAVAQPADHPLQADLQTKRTGQGIIIIIIIIRISSNQQQHTHTHTSSRPPLPFPFISLRLCSKEHPSGKKERKKDAATVAEEGSNEER